VVCHHSLPDHKLGGNNIDDQIATLLCVFSSYCVQFLKHSVTLLDSSNKSWLNSLKVPGVSSAGRNNNTKT
jgi:hypothetical protein